MNHDKLQVIFNNYIRQFDVINNAKHDENYKWRLAAEFPKLMDPDSADFVAGMKEVRKISYNLIDSQWHHPLSALIKCAEMDESAVRSLFRKLFADDGGSLIARQRKIDAFLTKSASLTANAHPGHKNMSQLRNDQRSAMSYLFFHDPDHHFLYKYEQARTFARCAEFEDDWGSGASFKMDIYYRMCDELVDAIKNYPPLLETTKRRYTELPLKDGESLHRDPNYHILAFDIIWGTGITDSPDYDFGKGTESLNPHETKQ